MTLLVRDEEDLLETNIEYHRSVGVDFFIIMDNNSIDKTKEIIQNYVTGMARMAYEEYNADWVINNDADEFWWSPDHDLRKELDNIPKDVGVVIVNRHDFIPQKGEVKDFYKFMDVKYKVSLNFFGQSLPPKALHRGSSKVEVSMGNHAAFMQDSLKTIVSERMEIFHYPIITYPQFERKIMKVGDLENSTSKLTRLRTLHEVHKQGKLEEYYNEQLIAGEKIEEEIQAGYLVRDTRLKEYISGGMKKNNL